MQVDSLPSEPPKKPKNTGVDSLSLLQGIFLTQESNWGLLHYRRTLYQLSYQGSPITQMYCSFNDFSLLGSELGWLTVDAQNIVDIKVEL